MRAAARTIGRRSSGLERVAKKTSRRLGAVAKLSIAGVTTFLALEVGLRIWDAAHETSPGLEAVLKNEREPIYSPHPFLSYTLRPGHGSGEVNTLGLRGPEVDRIKPSEVFRILCVGASTTYGAGVTADQAYPARLGQELATRAPAGVRYEVLNCGVPGYTSVESLVNFELRLLDLDPDVVLVYHGINDARLIQGRGFRADYTHARRSWRDPREQVTSTERWLVGHVRAWAWASALAGRGFAAMSLENLVYVDDYLDVLVPPESELNRPGISAFLRNLRNIVAVARANGVEPCLMTFATRKAQNDRTALYQPCIDALNEGILALAAAEGVPLFDVRAAIGGQTDLFWDYVHCNARGCELQARAIAEQALAQGLWGLVRPR